VNATGYRALGFLVWQGGKWYLRRRLPSRRSVLATGLFAGAALGAGVLLAKRLSA
jgi:hypothetical protein